MIDHIGQCNYHPALTFAFRITVVHFLLALLTTSIPIHSIDDPVKFESDTKKVLRLFLHWTLWSQTEQVDENAPFCIGESTVFCFDLNADPSFFLIKLFGCIDEDTVRRLTRANKSEVRLFFSPAPPFLTEFINLTFSLYWFGTIISKWIVKFDFFSIYIDRSILKTLISIAIHIKIHIFSTGRTQWWTG